MVTNYDPHLLYQAINITVELEYHVPMKTIYRILYILQKKRLPNEPEPSMKELVKMIKIMASSVESEGVEIEDASKDLKTRIKSILSMLGCELNNDELNKILKGQLSINDALTKEAQLAWNLIFGREKDRYVNPEQKNVDMLFFLAEQFAISNIRCKINQNYLKHAEYKEQQENKLQNSNYKTMRLSSKNTPDYLQENISLENKLRKMKIYIGQIQGYDKDWDGDGERGMDPETGEIRDYDDIFMADKRVDLAEIDQQKEIQYAN